MNEQNPLRLNLGCGLQCPQGWVNIDSSFGAKLARRPVLNKILHALIPASWGLLPNSQWASNVTWMDITRRFPYADNSVDAVYSSHTLEHLTWEEGSMVFKECYRVMKPGGVIRIIEPDLYVIIQHYMEAKSTKPEMAARKFLHDTYFFEIPIPKTLTGMIKFYFKRKNNHHFMYDADALRYQLEMAGFKDITPKAWGESAIEDIDKIDIPDRFRNAICLEGRK
jgi:Uncharacterized protein conserved in bacteria